MAHVWPALGRNVPLIHLLTLALCILFACLLAFPTSRSRLLYAIARPSSVCVSSVMLLRPTQAVEIFCNISTAFGTLAIR